MIPTEEERKQIWNVYLPQQELTPQEEIGCEIQKQVAAYLEDEGEQDLHLRDA